VVGVRVDGVPAVRVAGAEVRVAALVDHVLALVPFEV